MIINLSENNPYYDQRNNTMYPNGACNVTSMICALDASGITYEYPETMQPEDYLMQILETEESWKKLRSEYAWAVRDGYSPRHVHAMLDWAVNEKLVGSPVVETKTVSIQEILLSTLRGSAVVVTGRFTKAGHIVCVVGFDSVIDLSGNSRESDISLDMVRSVIVDDPYGNYHTGYVDHRGNDIRFTVKDFNNLTRNFGSVSTKLAHIFNNAV